MSPRPHCVGFFRVDPWPEFKPPGPLFEQMPETGASCIRMSERVPVSTEELFNGTAVITTLAHERLDSHTWVYKDRYAIVFYAKKDPRPPALLALLSLALHFVDFVRKITPR